MLLGLVIGTACSNEMDASDYDQDCASDDDCVAVFVGDVCDCSCDVGAINKRDQGRYDEEKPECNAGCGGSVCGPCPSPIVVCEAARCAIAR